MRFLFVFSVIVLLLGFKHDKYKIEGVVTANDVTEVYLLNGKDTLAKERVKKGKFKIQLANDASSILTLSWGKDKNMILFPGGEDIKVTITPESIKSSGGALQEVWERFLTEEEGYKKENASLMSEYNKERKAKNYFATRIIMAKSQKLDSARSVMENRFIKENDNILGAYIIKRRIRGIVAEKQIISKYELLGANARNTYIGKELEPYYKSAKVIAVGSVAPNFSLTSVNGEEVSFHDIKGKVKIIDFWASWCGPCRAANPYVRGIYAKYKDKGLEIVGVSLDNNKSKWEEAIKKDALPWIHISSLRGWECPVAIKYGIKSVPTVIMVDENNHILAIKPTDRDFEKILSEMLDK